MARRPSGSGPGRALKGLCGGALASLLGASAIDRRPVLRFTPTCYDLADFLVPASRHRSLNIATSCGT
eukprot:456259-Alexandrium_andersonii.AAC.1